MRAIVLLLVLTVGLGLALRFSFVGVILWEWISLQSPQQEAFGFIQSFPVNLAVVVVTVAAWIFSQERKAPPTGILFWLLATFLIWMTFNSFFAVNPTWSWPYWDRTWRIFALGLLIAATATSRPRIYALVWIAVISLFYFGVKGALFLIETGGHYNIYGAPNSVIADNNQLALALLMALPLANYLRVQVADKRIAGLLLAGIVLTTIAIVGTYSRGALVGLGALGLFVLLRMRNRFVYLAIAGVVIVFIVNFMPAHFFDRMNTIFDPGQDASFEGRLYAWRVATRYASDHFPFGAGFYSTQLPEVFNRYFPNQPTHAAHSIYFQVLGEHGFIGLAIYLAILAAAFLRSFRIELAVRSDPDKRWAGDLAVALQASLFVFCVAGAALSMAYYDLFVIEVALLLPLWVIVSPQDTKKRPGLGTTKRDRDLVKVGTDHSSPVYVGRN